MYLNKQLKQEYFTYQLADNFTCFKQNALNLGFPPLETRQKILSQLQKREANGLLQFSTTLFPVINEIII